MPICFMHVWYWQGIKEPELVLISVSFQCYVIDVLTPIYMSSCYIYILCIKVLIRQDTMPDAWHSEAECHMSYVYIYIYMYIYNIYNRCLTYCRFFIIGRLARHIQLLSGMIDAVCLACTFVWTWMEIIVSTTLRDMLGRVAFVLCIEPTFIWRALRSQLKKNVQHYRHVFMSCHLNYIYIYMFLNL